MTDMYDTGPGFIPTDQRMSPQPFRTGPVQVEVVNHPQPKKFEVRAAYRTCLLNSNNTFEQIAGYDPLRTMIRISGTTKNVIVCGSISQASDGNNAAGVATAKPNGRLLPLGTFEWTVEGQNEVWLTCATADMPVAIGYEIIRSVPES
jgi:hypothetical protein